MQAYEWLVLVYRVPSDPASRRVSVWRDLKRLGALYLQQCVCILPKLGSLADDVAQVARKIESMGGGYTLFDVPNLRADDEAKIVDAFRGLRDKEYAEIVEECETKFVKEVEFEHFRENYTFGEAEEIQQDLEKIRRWFEVVRARDWFQADGARAVETWLERCGALFGQFEEEVYRRAGTDQTIDESHSIGIVEGRLFGNRPSDSVTFVHRAAESCNILADGRDSPPVQRD